MKDPVPVMVGSHTIYHLLPLVFNKVRIVQGAGKFFPEIKCVSGLKKESVIRAAVTNSPAPITRPPAQSPVWDKTPVSRSP